MSKDDHINERFDEQFKMAASQVPVDFDPSGWEAMSAQLNAVQPTLPSTGGESFMQALNLNTIVSLVVELASLMVITVFVSQVWSRMNIEPNVDLQENIPVIEELIVDTVEVLQEELIPIDTIEVVKKPPQPKKKKLVSAPPPKDTVKVKPEPTETDSLDNFIFW